MTSPVLYVALHGFERAVFKAECEWAVTQCGALSVTMPRAQPGPLEKLATFAYGTWHFVERGDYDMLRYRHRLQYPKVAAKYDEITDDYRENST